MIVLYLFLTFFKIGLFTIGGGYAMIPMIQQDILSHGWVSQSDLIDFIAISESTPGPFAINIATFVGMSKAGLIGAVSATLGVVLPSFLIILIIAKFFAHFQDRGEYPRYQAGVHNDRRGDDARADYRYCDGRPVAGGARDTYGRLHMHLFQGARRARACQPWP